VRLSSSARHRFGLRSLALGMLLAASFTALPQAATSARAGEPQVQQTPDNMSIITQAERYLDRLTTLHAHFAQTVGDNGYTTGELWLSRPGKLRLNYDPPLRHQLVSDGTFLYFWDDEIKNVTQTLLKGSMVDLIVRKDPSLRDGVTVTRIRYDDNTAAVSIKSDSDPDQGELTLYFNRVPSGLLGWQVIDAQGARTEVRLTQVETDKPIDRDLFYFYRPDK
jgi:outer membrane lipoprotein-sorting protein